MLIKCLTAAKCIKGVLDGAKKSTAYRSKDLVIKATRRSPKRKNARIIEVVVTIGKPNYHERQVIKQLKSYPFYEVHND